MAIQSKTLSGAEHDWYATHSGESSSAPLSQHKKVYWASLGANNETEWLQVTYSSTSIDPYELWVAACQGESVTVGKSINECKFNYFTTVA